MTYEELKKRFKEEKLDQYGRYSFDDWIGGYCCMCIRKNEDGTINYCWTDERGSVESAYKQYVNIPEEEACDNIYRFATASKYLKEHRK
jgi:hypothetical protein